MVRAWRNGTGAVRRQVRRRAVAWTLVGVSAAALVGSASGADAGVRSHRSVPSPSVMIQVSTLAQASSPSQLRSWLRQICPSGVVPAGNVVLQDVADSSGTLLTDYLDVVEPFLPGASSHPCFGHVYVGTVEPSWTGSGSAYVAGVQDATFVADYVAMSAAVAGHFVQRYPQVAADWYVTYEANLNELFYPEVAAGYLSLLSSELQSFASVRRSGAVMWSPAFWYPYSTYSQNTLGMDGLSTSLTSLFSALRAYNGGIDVVDLQDYVAGSSCQPTYNQVTRSDAVAWVRFLKGLGVIPSVVVNTEQYSVDCATGGITYGDPTKVVARESYYDKQGLTLGPAFELRYWIYNHS